MRRLLLLTLFIILASSTFAAPNEGMLHYTSDPLNNSNFRLWNSGIGSEQNFSKSSGNVNWVDGAASPVREEHIQVELRGNGTLIANVQRESLFATKTLTTNFGNIAAQFKGFAVAYDPQGRAMIVYANDTIDPVYEIWNGTHFIGGGFMIQTDACRGTPRWMKLAADPNSNTMIMAELDTTASHCTQTWNGTTWVDGNFLVDTDLSSSVAPRLDIAFEQNNSQALVVYESDALGAPRYATWNGAWSGSSSVPGFTTDLIKWVELAPRDNSDHIALTAFQNSNATATVGVWSGNTWNTFTTIDSSIETGAQRPIDLAYQTNSDTLHIVYYDNDTNTPRTATCSGNNCLTGTFSTSALPALPTTTFLQLETSKTTSDLLLGALTDVNHETYLLHYTTSWNTWSLLGNTTNRNAAEDLKLVLDEFNDTIPPEVTSLQPAAASNISSGSSVTLGAEVDDFGVLDTVQARLTGPTGTNQTFTLSNTAGNVYSIAVVPSLLGRHVVTIIANDSAGNINSTQTTWFNYTNVGPRVNITDPAPNSGFSNATSITLRGNASGVPSPSIHGENLTWFSSIDGQLGTGENLTVNLSTGVHTITLRATDGYSQTNNASILIEFFEDRDRDGLADRPDTLEGDESWVITTGIDELDVVVGNDTNISGKGYTGVNNLTFTDNDTTLLEFDHNFSQSEIDLSTFELTVTPVVFLLYAPQLENTTKTLYFQNQNFTSLCMKTTPTLAASTITDDCSGANETSMTACLNNVNVTINGVLCSDINGTLRISNVTNAAFKARQPASVTPPVIGSSGGSRGDSDSIRGSSRRPPSTPSAPVANHEDPAGSGDEGQSRSQTVVPKAADKEPDVPEPIKEKVSGSSWWWWIALILGLLFIALSFQDIEKRFRRRGKLKGESFSKL